MEEALLEDLKAFFEMELTNKLIFEKNKIIVFLENGTKAEITIKNAV